MNRKAIGIAVAASVALAAVWYFALFSHQTHSLHQADAAVSQAHQEVASLRSAIATLQQEKTQLPSAASKLAALKLALPDNAALDKLIDNINAAAASAGVDWQEIGPAKPALYLSTGSSAASALPANTQAVNVSLQAEGSYQQILAFVTNLNGMPRLLDVTGVTVNGVTGAPKSTAQLSTQIFYVPSAGGATTATTVAP